MPVVPFEIEVGTLAILVRPKNRPKHPNDFGALIVDRRRIKVGDLEIGFGSDRMRQGPGVLRKLCRAQGPNLVDSLDGGRTHIRTETLVAKDGQPFLQRQLEPVTAGNAIARPVMKIFVRNHRCNRVEVGVARGFRVGQDVARVEDVEALVLHRPEVEVGNRDDVEAIEIIFAAIGPLVPGHGRFQGPHGVRGPGDVRLMHPDSELDLAAAHRGETVAVAGKIARDQSEQIARLGKRVLPKRPMTTVGAVTGLNRIAICEQHRKASLVRAQPDPIARQDVGTIREEGDPAEALGLALGAEQSA